MAPQACDHCGKVSEKLLRCSRCQQVAYCGSECQRDAWKGGHKAACGKAQAAAAAAAAAASKAAGGPAAPAAQRDAAAPDPAEAGRRGPGGRAALPPPLDLSTQHLRVVGVLSSHIRDEQRLARLDCCLRSVQEQTQTLAGFFAAWSAPEALAGAVERLLERLRAALAPTAPVRWLRQTRRTSQFYDIRWLHDELLSKEPPGTWLLFTDDDDLWGPERVRAYHTVIEAHAPTVGVTAVCATHKVRPVDRKKVARTAAEVARQLASGDARHCGGVRVEEEFFDFACPREVLAAFLESCNEETLLHPFADLRFTRFMSEYYVGGKVMYFPTDKLNPWVYYYSTAYRTPEDQEAFEQFDAQDQASTVVRVRPEDRELAAELWKKVSGRAQASEQELAEYVDLVSSLRQNIDGILIRHFPEDPMSVAEMKRVAVGQCQGQRLALQICERVARASCSRFGVRLE